MSVWWNGFLTRFSFHDTVEDGIPFRDLWESREESVFKWGQITGKTLVWTPLWVRVRELIARARTRRDWSFWGLLEACRGLFTWCQAERLPDSLDFGPESLFGCS
jgi:hypothetical protein